MLYFKLEEQLLTKENEKIIASGNCNVDKCEFTFDTTWDGFTKTAVFYQDKKNVYYAILDNENRCLIPASAMTKADKLYIGMFGIKGNQTVTSTLETTEILEGAISGIEINTEPSDDVFLAIITQYQQMAELMEVHNALAVQLEKSFTAFTNTVNIALNEQNTKLEELNAFDVLEVLAITKEIQEENAALKNRIDTMELSTFTIANVSIVFVNKIAKIVDSRITSESLVDVYFYSSTYEDALTAKIAVESKKGYIEFVCETAPTVSIGASIIVRMVD